ncbi:NUDIX domain-containing protein [Candidatus Shapirobacteria bacterium]|nr:NUDIX domain-containing protein [Candidatus Shapirobacteria bacterium]
MVDIEETKVGAHALLVTSEGKIILQQRDEKPGIVNPGLISMFGGSAQKGELMEECLERELKEELEINIYLDQVKKLGIFYKTKEIDGQDYEANVFVVKGVEVEKLKVNEGKGIVCDCPAELLKLKKLTRVTRLALEHYRL